MKKVVTPISEPRIGQYNCHGGDKEDCKKILKNRYDFMCRNIDELEDSECIVLKVIVFNQGGKMHLINEKELREYEKGTDFFDILADPKLLCLYDDGE